MRTIHDTTTEIVYPESDGQPMAENTEQFNWIVLIKENLEALFANDPAVFVAGDLLWYAVEGNPEERRAPDTMVAFGRPKGRRGSYRQWEEGGIAPQVVFEILSPGNTTRDMADKYQFYDTHGVEEYYIYDPDTAILQIMLRTEQGALAELPPQMTWVSPRLGIHFDRTGAELRLSYPDGQPFLSVRELREQRDAERRARQQAEHEREAERSARQQAEQEREAERNARQQAEARMAALVAKLRGLGIDINGEDA